MCVYIYIGVKGCTFGLDSGSRIKGFSVIERGRDRASTSMNSHPPLSTGRTRSLSLARSTQPPATQRMPDSTASTSDTITSSVEHWGLSARI